MNKKNMMNIYYVIFIGLVYLISYLQPNILKAQTPNTDQKVTILTHTSKQVQWAGLGTHRILVRVDPVDLGNRNKDELVASIDLDFTKLLHGRPVNLSTIQVMKYDPQTGLPERYDNNMYQKSPYDCIIRFYDNSVPWHFPQHMGYPTFTKGQGTPVEFMDNAGRYYNLKADGKGGKLAWMHTQVGNQLSYYAIYFDALKPGEKQTMPPIGWVGDGSNRVIPNGPHFVPWNHANVCVTDWTGNGLPDLLIGNELGSVLYYRNIGTVGHPKYDAPRLLETEDGQSLDIGGCYASPLAVDWDGDGKKDLLVGAEKECVVFYKNVGTNKHPILRNMGLLQADGKDLRIPKEPCPEHGDLYAYDYNPVPEVVDWKGNGKPDLLLGGYITGYIWYYENEGRDSTGKPILHFKGALQADGKDLDVGWCAAPTVGDLHHNGKFDLISGSMPVTPEGGDSTSPDRFLLYYENIGTREHPMLTQKPFPKIGEFPNEACDVPRLVDLYHHGLLDLVVSVGDDVYIYKNIGTKTKPLFDVRTTPLHANWGNAPLFFKQTLNSNKDGYPNLVSGTQVSLNTKQGSPFNFNHDFNLIPPGKEITHPSTMGDTYSYEILYDFSGDGLPDVLYGDHDGYVWFHKNIGTAEHPDFDTAGVKFMTQEGIAVKVGLSEKELKTAPLDWEIMQGARPTIAAGDFKGNGKNDLVVCDTYGKIWLFENIGTNHQPLFAQGTVLAKLHDIRLQPLVTDWNPDGKPDILVFYVSGQNYLFLNQSSGGEIKFSAPIPIKLSELMPMNRSFALGDLNHHGYEDLYLFEESQTCYEGRTFIQYGYREAKVLRIEQH
jgi:hypothetical protein